MKLRTVFHALAAIPLIASSAPVSAQGSICTLACQKALPDICADSGQVQYELDIRLLERARARKAYEASPLATEFKNFMPRREKLRREYAFLANELEQRGNAEAPRGDKGFAALKTSEIKKQLEGVTAELEKLARLQERAHAEQRRFITPGLEEQCTKDLAVLKETGGKSLDQLQAELNAMDEKIKALDSKKAIKKEAELEKQAEALRAERKRVYRQIGLLKEVEYVEARK